MDSAELLGAPSHPYFRMHRLVVHGSAPWPHAGVFTVVIVSGGVGVAETMHGQLPVRRGDTLAILAATAETTLHGDLELVVATPSFA